MRRKSASLFWLGGKGEELNTTKRCEDGRREKKKEITNLEST